LQDNVCTKGMECDVVCKNLMSESCAKLTKMDNVNLSKKIYDNVLVEASPVIVNLQIWRNDCTMILKPPNGILCFSNPSLHFHVSLHTVYNFQILNNFWTQCTPTQSSSTLTCN
jgi:hypothetical protein